MRDRTNSSIRLDYLGIESRNSTPVLAVETKRPRDMLPIDTRTGERPTHERAVAQLIAEGIKNPSRLGGEWADWVSKLGDYLHGIQAGSGIWPRRAVVTNGHWLVIFEDPAGTFADNGIPDPKRVTVIPDLRQLSLEANRIFDLLAYQNLIDDVGPLTPSQLPFRVQREGVKRIMFGTRVSCGSKSGWLKTEPTIYVQPMLFVNTSTSGWFRILENDAHFEHELPDRPEELKAHFAACENCAQQLLASLVRAYGFDADDLEQATLEEHFAADDCFGTLKPVTALAEAGRQNIRAFEVVTGKQTHFLLRRPRQEVCPYHEFAKANRKGYGATSNEVTPRNRVQERTFFCSGSQYHCAHRLVLEIKRSTLSSANRLQCGARSGSNGSAFCEVFSIDHHLCCQACVFFEVCRKTDVFRLPCID